jgi:hypothetical protein
MNQEGKGTRTACLYQYINTCRRLSSFVFLAHSPTRLSLSPPISLFHARCHCQNKFHFQTARGYETLPHCVRNLAVRCVRE